MVPCPKCGREPEAVRVRSFWIVRCPVQHFPMNMQGHPMHTKLEAETQWNEQFKPASSVAS